jgi:Beta propeller domain
MMRTRTLATMPVLAGLIFAAGCAPDGPDATGRTTSTTRPPDTTTGTTQTTDTTPDTTTGTTTPHRTGGPFGSSRLAFFDDCPALLDHMQAMARERVTAWGFGAGGWYGPDVMMAEEATATTRAAAADESAAGAAEPTAAPAYSTTNTQEVGVDEGDVVETDGAYVYAAGPDGVRIVDVAGVTVVEQLELPAGDHQLLLDGDRLVVTTQTWNAGEDTIVSVFDVTDPTSPVLLRRSHLEGRLVAARAADGTVRLVLSSSFAARLPFVQPQMFGLDEERALERNRQIIDESAVQDWLPRWFDEAGDGSFGEMAPALDCSTVAAPADFSGLGVSWIASIDLDADAMPVGSAGIVSTGETVYASPTGLYVATVPWDWYMGGDTRRPMPEGQPPTSIHEFALGDGTRAEYVASGTVPGTLLNQFSMSEYEGVLRVATTALAVDGSTESSVHTLRTDTMEPIASIGGLGAGEQIYAVRFLGPTAYVVTFRQVDPLYVLDLADPANPIMSGELKIPGYSAYLHPVGDGLLLGVGQDATDQGMRLGTQLSLFDVSDPSAPQRLATLPVGGWSDAEWDHHAFLFWPEDGTIVLPVSPGWNECGPAVDCLAGGITSPAGGVVVARLVDRTLEPVGTVSHEARDASGCWNPLRRSLVIGDELVTVGMDQMRFSDRATLGERATVTWGSVDEYGCTWWVE